jgi:hypothetical protein
MFNFSKKQTKQEPENLEEALAVFKKLEDLQPGKYRYFEKKEALDTARN